MKYVFRYKSKSNLSLLNYNVKQNIVLLHSKTIMSTNNYIEDLLLDQMECNAKSL